MSNLTLFQELENLLRPHSQYCTEDGVLLKNSVVEAALQLRPDLLKLILSNEKLKANFFAVVDELMVFDKVRFQKFVMNKRFLPDSYTSFKNKIGLTTDDGDFLSESREVVLSWPYKDCVLEGGQTKEDAKRNEVFWNEILAPDEINRLTEPKVLTNFKKFDANGEHKVDNISKADNLIIKGNNLLALHSLKKNYAGQVKLIYIDPPYNTGSDGFQYNDSFNHSTWLTFMKNRLEIAKVLLANEGFLCCHIDNSEGEYLKVLMDDVFGRENHLNTFYIRVRYPDKTLKQDMDFHKEIETIFIYRKSNRSKPILTEVETNLDKYIYYFEEIGQGRELTLGGKKVTIYNRNEIRIIKKETSGKGRKEIWATGSVLDGNSSGRFFRDFLEGRYDEDGFGVVYKVYGVGDEIDGYRYFTGPQKDGATKGKYYQGVPSKSLVTDNNKTKTIPINNFYDLAGSFGNCRLEGGVEFRSGKKPEELLKTIVTHFSSKEDIVLDYHLGSGSTAAVAHKMGRRFIGLEQMDYGQNDSVIRLKNVIGKKVENDLFDKIEYDQSGISKAVNWQGGGSFVYCELAKANQEFADKILNSNDKEELSAIWQHIQETGFLSWKVNPSQIDENASDFAALSVEDTQKFLLEALDKNLLYVPLSEIDNEEFGVSQDDKQLNAQFYGKA